MSGGVKELRDWGSNLFRLTENSNFLKSASIKSTT